MPQNTTAVIMKAKPGAEMQCRAHSHDFTENGITQRRGVISYYFARALSRAKTLSQCVEVANQLVQNDVLAGRLPPAFRPAFKIEGVIAPVERPDSR